MNELTISAVACTCCPYGRDFLSVFRYGVVGFCSLFCIFLLIIFSFFPILSHIRRKICRRHVYCARFENQLWPVD